MQFSQQLLRAAIASALVFTAQAQAPRAKNIVVMVADGWCFNHIEATDYYQNGELGKQVYEREFALYPMSTFSVNGSYDPAQGSNYDYLLKGATDSAAAATTSAAMTSCRCSSTRATGSPASPCRTGSCWTRS